MKAYRPHPLFSVTLGFNVTYAACFSNLIRLAYMVSYLVNRRFLSAHTQNYPISSIEWIATAILDQLVSSLKYLLSDWPNLVLRDSNIHNAVAVTVQVQLLVPEFTETHLLPYLLTIPLCG